MSKTRIEYWHKKQGKGASPSATVRHASVREGRPVLNAAPKLTGAQAFMQKLKTEIKRAV